METKQYEKSKLFEHRKNKYLNCNHEKTNIYIYDGESIEICENCSHDINKNYPEYKEK